MLLLTIVAKINKYIIFIFLLVFLSGISWYLGFKYKYIDKKTEITQESILEQVKSVLKLGTVEGYFSDIYSYKEYYGFDISPFQKKALIRIKAKVLTGFDLDNIAINIDEKNKTVSILNIPYPKIISIDHDLDYYDITEGTFNSFSNEDYNKMNKQAKSFIKNTALKSDLFIKAQKQLTQHLELLKSILKTYGWTLKIKYKAIENLPKD